MNHCETDIGDSTREIEDFLYRLAEDLLELFDLENQCPFPSNALAHTHLRKRRQLSVSVNRLLDCTPNLTEIIGDAQELSEEIESYRKESLRLRGSTGHA